MIRTLFSFGVGVYVGVYVAQNYEIQKVDEPAVLWGKIKAYIDENLAGKKKD